MWVTVTLAVSAERWRTGWNEDQTPSREEKLTELMENKTRKTNSEHGRLL